MLLVVIALLWGAFLVPLAVRHLREWRSERAIEHFTVESQVRAPAAAPAVPRAVPMPTPTPARPRLRVVHEGDTYRSLEAERSWDEWASDYEFDETPTRASRSAMPTSRPVSAPPVARGRSMRRRRRVVFTRLLVVSVLATLGAWLTGASILWDLTFALWCCLVAFVALAIYAVGQGYLHESSVGLSVLSRRGYLEPTADLDAIHHAPRTPAWTASSAASERWEDADDEDGYGDGGGYGYAYDVAGRPAPRARHVSPRRSASGSAWAATGESRYAVG